MQPAQPAQPAQGTYRPQGRYRRPCTWLDPQGTLSAALDADAEGQEVTP